MASTCRPTFPDSCLTPDQPGFGQIVKPGTGKRRSRRNPKPGNTSNDKHDWTVISPAPPQVLPSSVQANYASSSRDALSALGPHAHLPRRSNDSHPRATNIQEQNIGSPIALHRPYEQIFQRPDTASTSYSSNDSNYQRSPTMPHSLHGHRYAPYHHSLPERPRAFSNQFDKLPARTSPPLRLPHFERRNSLFAPGEKIVLPPLKAVSDHDIGNRRSSLTLPPISSMDGVCERPSCDDSTAVLQRLKSSDDDNYKVHVAGISRDDDSAVGRRISHPAASCVR